MRQHGCKEALWPGPSLQLDSSALLLSVPVWSGLLCPALFLSGPEDVFGVSASTGEMQFLIFGGKRRELSESEGSWLI